MLLKPPSGFGRARRRENLISTPPLRLCQEGYGGPRRFHGFFTTRIVTDHAPDGDTSPAVPPCQRRTRRRSWPPRRVSANSAHITAAGTGFADGATGA